MGSIFCFFGRRLGGGSARVYRVYFIGFGMEGLAPLRFRVYLGFRV